MNNSARGADAANATTLSNISGPGPGHNAWLMTSALLVLFMTLPGLALFYGGLVRQKNVLSILAQCLGIAGLVSILWWAIGYSLVFAHGCAFFGRNPIRISAWCHRRPQYRLLLLGFAQRLCHVSAHVRHYYSCAHHRIGGGAHEIFRGHGHRWAVDVFSLFPVSPYGLGH